jgi:hypothetical protein
MVGRGEQLGGGQRGLGAVLIGVVVGEDERRQQVVARLGALGGDQPVK